MDYAPGSPERASLRLRLEQMRNERLDVPLVIGGEDVRTGTTLEAVEPHDTSRVLADVHQGGGAEVERAIEAEAGERWTELGGEDGAVSLARERAEITLPARATSPAASA